MVKQVKDEFGDVRRFCNGYFYLHFPIDCPNNPDNTHTSNKGKSPFHAVSAIPLRGEKEEPTIPVQVVTREQALIWEETIL